jgi:hypothetical protein
LAGLSRLIYSPNRSKLLGLSYDVSWREVSFGFCLRIRDKDFAVTYLQLIEINTKLLLLLNTNVKVNLIH